MATFLGKVIKLYVESCDLSNKYIEFLEDTQDKRTELSSFVALTYDEDEMITQPKEVEHDSNGFLACENQNKPPINIEVSGLKQVNEKVSTLLNEPPLLEVEKWFNDTKTINEQAVKKPVFGKQKDDSASCPNFLKKEFGSASKRPTTDLVSNPVSFLFLI